MIFEAEYYYTIISKYDFDEKFLISKSDGSTYKKYILVYYKINNRIESTEIQNMDNLNKISNVVSFYEVEEITSSCVNFDSDFKYKKYYNINDKLYFTKYLVEDDYSFLIQDNDFEKVKAFFRGLNE